MEYIFGLILSAIFGAIFGSYATLFAYRLPLGESCFGRYFGPKSRCPQCGVTIKTRDLIPVLNWLITLGRCRNCKIKIPRTHFFIEVTTTILFVLCYINFSFSEEFIVYSILSVGLLVLLICDFTHKAFPQSALSFILMFALVSRVLNDRTIIDLIFSIAVGVIFAVVFYHIFYKKTNGLFASQDQSLNYTKFILIAAIFFQQPMFLFYFLIVMTIFTMLLLFKIPLKKQRNNFGYVFIIPYLWLMLYPPFFS